MRTRIVAALSLLLLFAYMPAEAQDYNQLTDTGEFTNSTDSRDRTRDRDSLSSRNKEIPKGLKVWTVDERFGERTAAEPDTLPHMYMNSIFDTGMRGEYRLLCQDSVGFFRDCFNFLIDKPTRPRELSTEMMTASTTSPTLMTSVGWRKG